MDQFSGDVQGFDKLIEELRRLPEQMQSRVMKGALATGANVIKREAVLLAPESTGPVSEGHPPPGTLKRAIYAARLMDQCTTTLEVWKVGVRSGKRAQSVGKKGANLDAFYAGWVEHGHYARVSKELGKDAKKAGRALGVAVWVQAQPFMRPAFETKKGEAVQAMQNYVRERLPQVAALFNYLKAA